MFLIKLLSVLLVAAFPLAHYVIGENTPHNLGESPSINQLSFPEISSVYASPRSPGRQKRALSKQIHNITIHNSTNFDGVMAIQGVQIDGCVTWRAGDYWNDNISAIVLHGQCVRAWAYEDCTGYSTCLCFSKAKKLNEIMMTPWRSWDNEITSLSGWTYTNRSALVTLYDQQNLIGDANRQGLRPGECVSFFHGDAWNDKISSVNVNEGCVEFFIHAFCRGSSFKVTQKIENSVGSAFDKKISSIRAC